MSKDLIISRVHFETRIALLENSEMIDFFIHRGSHKKDLPQVGNIYLGKVLRVLPGMQSAFVDIGYDKAAFLYVDDAYIPTLEEQREMAKKLEELEKEGRLAKSGAEMIPDELSSLSETVDMRYRTDLKIQEVLKEGDQILVQVAKEPISTKGPRVTRHITLAGRYVVFMPYIEHIGVSRRIEEDQERERLKTALESIRPDGKGMIARTVAESQSHKTLKADYSLLSRLWKDIQKRMENQKAPHQLHHDLDFVQRCLRDIIDEDVDNIFVDDRNDLKKVEKFVNKYLPGLKGKVKFYEGKKSLFEDYDLEIEIERALSNKVYLKSGGSINIDQTEALVSIDVNTGKFVGKRSLEDTILKTNLEAVKEIVYQLRVRNCGGIIIIDFIDMESEDHRDQVFQALLDALRKDRAKTNVLPISEFGLVQMTRKRTRDTLTRLLCTPCPYCEGVGRVKSVSTVCYEIIREVSKKLKKKDISELSIFSHPEVSAQLTSQDFEVLEALEEKYGVEMLIRADNSYHIEQYEIFTQEE